MPVTLCRYGRKFEHTPSQVRTALALDLYDAGFGEIPKIPWSQERFVATVPEPKDNTHMPLLVANPRVFPVTRQIEQAGILTNYRVIPRESLCRISIGETGQQRSPFYWLYGVEAEEVVGSRVQGFLEKLAYDGQRPLNLHEGATWFLEYFVSELTEDDSIENLVVFPGTGYQPSSIHIQSIKGLTSPTDWFPVYSKNNLPVKLVPTVAQFEAHFTDRPYFELTLQKRYKARNTFIVPFCSKS